MIKPYYKQERFILYLGDCLEVLKQFPKNHFDMIFADPPYHLSNGGFTCHAGKRVSVNKGKWDESKGIKEDFDFLTYKSTKKYELFSNFSIK